MAYAVQFKVVFYLTNVSIIEVYIITYMRRMLMGGVWVCTRAHVCVFKFPGGMCCNYSVFRTSQISIYLCNLIIVAARVCPVSIPSQHSLMFVK